MDQSRNRVIERLGELLDGRETELGRVLFELEVQSCMRALPGRETFLVDLADPLVPRVLDVDGDVAGVAVDAQLPVVVKRFAASDGAEARFELLHGRLPRSPAQREAENLSAMLGLGLRVPEPLYWFESGAASVLVMEYLPHAVTLRQLLERGAGGLLVRDLAEIVGRMHAAGWYHRDMYLEHVVVLGDGQLGLLDLGRARHGRRPASRWFVKDLAALSSSAPGGMLPARLAFAARYFVMLDVARRGAKRRFLGRVERRAKRMLAHVPRHKHSKRGLDSEAAEG